MHRIRTVVATAALAAGGLVAIAAPAAHAEAAGKGGNYIALAHEGNLMDTRTGVGVPKAKLGDKKSVTFQATGAGGVPTTGVSAVLVDVTDIAPTAAGWLAIYASGGDRGGTSITNHVVGKTISNSATVAVGSDGKVTVYNEGGTVDVRVDIQGYFTSANGSSGPGGLVPVSPVRLVDTRTGIGTPKAKIAAQGTLTVALTGDVVPTTADSVYLDAIVIGSAGGWLGSYPAGGTPATTSDIDFVAGVNSDGLSAKLSADGKVTFVNHSAAAIDLVLTAEGYTSSVVSEGAGFRSAEARLSQPVTLAANATTDIQIGGRNGLPTRGIAAAALSLGVTGATATGFLHAWPVGGSEPGTSVLNFNPTTRASFAVVAPGTESKIRIRNVSEGTARVYVDLLGWFADPLPTVPVSTTAPMSVIQEPATSSGPGALDYAYVDGAGQVHAGHQTNLDDSTSVQWPPISSIDDKFAGQPALAVLPDQSVQIVVQNVDSNVWSQSTVSPPNWPSTPFAHLGGSMATSPAVGTLPDKNVVLFAVDADGRLWMYPESGSAQYWQSLGLANLAGTPAVVPLSSGLRMFARTTAGTVATATYISGALSAWTDLGGSGVTSDPAATLAPGALAAVVVTEGDGSVVIKSQDSNGSFPADWASVSAPASFTAKGSPAVVFNRATGELNVLARGADDFIWESDETAPGTGVFGDWVSASAFPSGTSPIATGVAGSANTFWVATYRTAAGSPHLLASRLQSQVAGKRASVTTVDRQLSPPTR